MSFTRDLRHALRSMTKNRGFTAVAVTVLALGIGANTALFSVLDRVLLDPLPYAQPEELLQIGRQLPAGQSNAVTISQYLYWREHNGCFSDMALYEGRGGGLNLVPGELAAGDRPERVASLGVSPSFFRVLGVPPQVGRDFTEADGEPGAAKVAMISDGLWRRRFAADPAIVGRPIRLSGEEHTVVGVMANGFDFINHADVWTPLHLEFNPQGGAAVYYTLARLHPDRSVDAARSEMAAIAESLRAEHPQLLRDGVSIFVRPYLDQLVGNVRPALLMLLGAVGLVLLIACANVANLLLARARGRRREIAVRASLGASRMQLLRQLLVESLVLALTGGALGLLLARAGMGVLVRWTPSGLPRLDGIEIDVLVIGFTFAVTLLTGILFGLIPAWHGSKADLQAALKSAQGTGGQRSRGRGALVVAEVALALVLLVGALLLVQSFLKVTALDPGYDYEQILTFKMSPTPERQGETASLTTSQVTRFTERAVERLLQNPGIEAAATVSMLPLEHGLMYIFDVEGREPADAATRQGRGQWRQISADYFHTMGIPLLRGRTFDSHDSLDAPTVVVVNEALAEQYFPDENPIGRRLLTGPPGSDTPPDLIVGVVGDVSELALDRPPTPTVFTADTQASDGTTGFLADLFPTAWVVRTSGNPASYGPLVRREILALNPEQPISDLRTMADLMAGNLAARRFSTLLLGLFAALALALAVVGIYGVMSYTVAQRTHEIGIRQALGADAGATLRLILHQGLRLAGYGIVLGLLAALGLSRLIQAMLFDTAPTSLSAFATAALAILVAAVFACLIPARRATRVDPLVALRAD